MFDEISEIRSVREENANVRAGLIAAEIINWSGLRRRGARKITPSDFFPSRSDHLSPEEAVMFLDRWATTQNRKLDQ